MVLGKSLASLGGESTGGIWNPRYWFTGPMRRTVSGETVTPSNALSCGPYYACLRAVSEDVGVMPLRLYKEIKGRKVEATEHPVHSLLLHRANPSTTAQTFFETLTHYGLGWGNGIAEIQRDGAGDPVALWPIHPSRVRFEKRAEGGVDYWVKTDDIASAKVNEVRIPASDVFHFHGLGDGDIGYPVSSLGAESVGLAKAQNDFAASFFGNGAHSAVILRHPGQLGAEGRKNLRDSWNEAYQGAKNANQTTVLEEGLEVERLSIPPNEAQFLESRQWQVEEICRWFRVPPMKVGHNQNTPFTNVEQLNLVYYNDALLSNMRRISDEVREKLLNEKERRKYEAKHDRNLVLLVDAKGRAEYYRTMINASVMQPNEARALENLPQVDNGDINVIQSGMTTLDKVASGENMTAKQPSTPKKDPGGDRDGEEPMDPQASDTARPFISAEITRLCRKESAARNRALKKHAGNPEALMQWSGRFYSEFSDDVFDSMYPAVSMFGHGPECRQVIDQYCAEAVNRAEPDPIALAESICKELFNG